ncbi:MAG: hypothetical protein HOO99_11860 [Hyphomicrobiaceae bacterium]|nr:hypothetical protein [Hyphomicrobiaceae bacterium]
MYNPFYIAFYIFQNAVFYAVGLAGLSLLVHAIVPRPRFSRILSLAGAMVCLSPFVFAVIEHMEDQAAPEKRRVELASFGRQPVDPSLRPRVVSVANENLARGLSNLAATGAIYAVIIRPDVHRKTAGGQIKVVREDGCVAKNLSYIPDELLAIGVARQGLMRCLGATIDPVTLESDIDLFTEADAPSRSPKRFPNEGNVSGSVLEVRWSPRRGGQLISYDEVYYRTVMKFPPQVIWWPRMNFLRNNISFPDVDGKVKFVPMPSLFLASAMQYREPNDFPLTATEAEVAGVLRRVLAPGIPNANAVLTLLGQWKTSPEIAAALGDLHKSTNGLYRVMSEISSDNYGKYLKYMQGDAGAVAGLRHPFLYTHAGELLKALTYLDADGGWAYSGYSTRWRKTVEYPQYLASIQLAAQRRREQQARREPFFTHLRLFGMSIPYFATDGEMRPIDLDRQWPSYS